MSAHRFACLSHEGKTHTSNQDRWLADPERGLYLVADGMANDTAPDAVVCRLPELFADILSGAADLGDRTPRREIADILNKLNDCVRDAMRKSFELGLGTTLVLALVRGGKALVAHLGDSRAYWLRGHELTAVTRDHSYCQELLDRGVISAEEANATRGSGGPTRFLGMSGSACAEIQVLELARGDRLLLCSDGLTVMLTDEQIRDILTQDAGLEDICRQLVDAANAAGGEDNITALVIEVGGEP